MKQKLFRFFRTNRQGIALVTVLGVVTLATILILALFTASDNEFKASRSYADGATSRFLADNAVNLVIGQIQSGASPDPSVIPPPTIWASQPGAVRTYNANGKFAMGWKLFSSDKMVVPGGSATLERAMSVEMPASDWNQKPVEWVDLNAPVIKVPSGGGTARVYFPILDPRAMATVNGTPGIEGFAYAKRGFDGGGDVNGVEDSIATPETMRVPMPVRWLYQLRDGTLGTVQQSASSGGAPQPGSWNTVAGSGNPSETNPIIGRMAFWTDDESCRVNVNTAGEPGFWALPVTFGDRDKNWVDSPPAVYEYQRYPGHPATVALSSVLSPNPTQSRGTYDADAFPAFQASYEKLKSTIYDIAPRLTSGGSGDGNKVFDIDDFNANVMQSADALWTSIRKAKTERLYTSVDEMIFKQYLGGNNTRQAVDGTAGAYINESSLQRTRFFLSANSRAPETNMFGLPRVCIWPVPDQALPVSFSTAFDRGIAYASTLGPQNSANTYFFSRRDYSSPLTDIGRDVRSQGLQRNAVLMTYLDKLTSRVMPGGGSFQNKYGVKDTRQILVNIFDYIRSTNLYDSFLDAQLYGDKNGAGGQVPRPVLDDNSDALTTRFNATRPTNKAGQIDQRELWKRRPAPGTYYTYTPPRFNVVRRAGDIPGIPTGRAGEYQQEAPVATGMWPGHGQVTPSEWSIGGEVYKGMGRFPTISEVALHFICTGDGGGNDPNLGDKGAYWIQTANGRKYSGGKTAMKINTAKENARIAKTPSRTIDPATGQERPADPDSMWYSNLPPFPGKALFERWGCDFSRMGTGLPSDPLKHPAIDSARWNATLDWNATEGGIELKPDEKRIQVAMEFELFVPQVGFTKIAPDFTLVVNGEQVSALEVQDGEGKWRKMFSTTEDKVIQSSTVYFGSSMLGESGVDNGVSPMGGNYGTVPLLVSRQAASIGKMPKDPGYASGASGDVHGAMLNYPLLSNFFTVKRNDESGKPGGSIPFRSSGGAIQVDIYASHDWQGVESKQNGRPVQSVQITVPPGRTPKPWLVTLSTERIRILNNNGSETKFDAVNAVRWWAFNDGGAVERWTGKGRPGQGGIDWSGVKEAPAPVDDGFGASTWGRFRGGRNVTSAPTKAAKISGGRTAVAGLIFGFSPDSNFSGTPNLDAVYGVADRVALKGVNAQTGEEEIAEYDFYGTDSIRSLVPKHGDYRILASRRVVGADMWTTHRLWDSNLLFAHSITGNKYGTDVGADTGGDPTVSTAVESKYRMVRGAWYPSSQVPDTPLTEAASRKSERYRDFDNGPGDMRDGAFTNKADDGNLSVTTFWLGATGGATPGFYKTRNAYFLSSFLQMPATNAFFTPNRMVSSPGIFGSIPSGVWGSQPRSDPDATSSGVAWRTLLFRPDINGPEGSHVGAPGTEGGVDPADHYFMDLFWMPVVEPYAISYNYSSAGKVNMNFQMLPFGHIRRSTGMHAVLKGEMITAFGPGDTANANPASATNTVIYKSFRNGNTIPREFWHPEAPDNKDWHHAIHRERTIKQLSDRFAFGNGYDGDRGGLLRTASQLCELHLVPYPSTTRVEPRADTLGSSPSQLKSDMTAFWNFNKLTGDNVRERPYANIYQKVTTKSNSFRVYFKVQTIRKARTVPPDQVDETRDTIGAEYQGSALLERYLDLTSTTTLPDYAADPFGPASLEKYHRFRVLEMKQFSP